MRVAFLCKGSRGDVEPLLALVVMFHKSKPAVDIVFVCCLSAVRGLESALAREEKWLKICYLPETCTHTSNEMGQTGDSLRQTMLNREVRCCVDACSDGVNGVVFNLFTLEGYMIARHLNVPSVAVSPFLITRTPPKTFEKKFAQEHPFLYDKLKNSCSGLISYKEIDHWMWRLFLDDLSAACDAAGIESFPIPYPSSSVVPPLWSLPRPTQLLYGVSPVLAHEEQFWPESVHVCGFWKLPEDWCIELADSKLQAFIDNHSDRLVYTGFGSMERYMVGINWNTLLDTLNKVLEALNLYSIVQCLEDGPLLGGVLSSSLSNYTSLHLCSDHISHSWLFPKCSAVIHHGGAGTVSSAIIAGVPQIICPVMFDQTRWGEIIEWKGLGKNINTGPCNLTYNQLYTSIKSIIDSSVMKLNVKKVKEIISEENGLETAVILIEKEVQT